MLAASFNKQLIDVSPQTGLNKGAIALALVLIRQSSTASRERRKGRIEMASKFFHGASFTGFLEKNPGRMKSPRRSRVRLHHCLLAAIVNDQCSTTRHQAWPGRPQLRPLARQDPVSSWNNELNWRSILGGRSTPAAPARWF